MSCLPLITRMPIPLLQLFCNLGLEAIRRSHPLMFQRMGPLEGAWFAILPQDTSLMFFLRASSFSPRLLALKQDTPHPHTPSATITAPLAVLLDMLSGRADGDAVFFGRDLRITGDMEAVLALRNALDGAAINPSEDLAAFLGPLSGLMQGVLP